MRSPVPRLDRYEYPAYARMSGLAEALADRRVVGPVLLPPGRGPAAPPRDPEEQRGVGPVLRQLVVAADGRLGRSEPREDLLGRHAARPHDVADPVLLEQREQELRRADVAVVARDRDAE